MKPLASTIRITALGTHENVTVWMRDGGTGPLLAKGSLLVPAGEGRVLASALMPGAEVDCDGAETVYSLPRYVCAGELS